MLRDYVFYETTRSFCSTCLELCDAKIIIKNGSAYLLKTCLEHGTQLELFEEDASYLLAKQAYDKPGNRIRPEFGNQLSCPLCVRHPGLQRG